MNNSTRTALILNGQIEIAFPYDMGAIQAVRDIEGRRWDGTNKVWKVPFTPWHCDRIVKQLKPLNFYIDPNIVQNANGKVEKPKLKLPKELYNYQKEGVKFIYATGGRCIVGDDMGVGKSAQALTFVDQFCGKTLIVSPSSVVVKWAEKECAMWAKGKTVQVITKGKDIIQPDADIIVMSYGLMVTRFEELNQIPFNCVIFDESHYIKSHKAQRTRIAKALVKSGIPHCLFLSGTPFMNRPIELFPVLNMIDSKAFGNFYHFASRYCGFEYLGGMWVRPDKDTVTNADELAKRLSHIMLRRTKNDVLSELPDLTRSFIPVPLDNMADYRTAKRDVKEWLTSQGQTAVDPNHVLTRLNVLRQVVGQGKIKAALELAEDILQGDQKVVLFAHHKEVVRQLIDGLKTYGVGVISGDVAQKDRQAQVNEFLKETLISQKGIRVMIITVAGAEGIDLYSASHIIFVEREWTPAKEEQAEARLHRIGQKNPVTAHYLVAQGTIDEKLHDLVDTKRKMFGSVIRQDEILTEIME